MKKNFAVALLCIVYTFSTQAQNVYSKRNLEQASQEELNHYLGKAWKLQKVGGIMFVSGTLGSISGLLLGAHGMNNGNDDILYLGGGIFYVSFITAVIGAPIHIINNSREKKIINIVAKRSNRVSIEMVPCGFYDNLAQNYQLGVTLRLRL